MTDEPSVFARGPAVLPLPWSVCTAAQHLRPLASAAALPRGEGWRASREADGVSVLWREPQGEATYRRVDNQRTECTPWLLLHGIGGADRRCIDGLVRECRALHNSLLALPIHPNWESYGTVPANYSPSPGPARRNGAEPVTPDDDARFVTTRAFVRAVGGALAHRRLSRVHVIAWSLGACFATMLREEFPALELGHVVFVDPAAALPLANSAWGWLLEPRISRTLGEFRRRSQRCGLGAWLLHCGGGEIPGGGGEGSSGGGDEGGGSGSGGGGGDDVSSRLLGAAAAALDVAGAAAVAAACRTDHLRVAPELHPCAHGCDIEGALLDREAQLELQTTYPPRD